MPKGRALWRLGRRRLERELARLRRELAGLERIRASRYRISRRRELRELIARRDLALARIDEAGGEEALAGRDPAD